MNRSVFFMLLMHFCFSLPLYAQNHIQLSLETAVDLAMRNSYRIKQLEMGIERSRYWLKARQASLKSRVYMNLQAPQLSAESDFQWDSNLQKDIIVKQNTTRWQMDLAVRQPVIIMGYPTNGYLSLNNKTYKYTQRDGPDEINYYNRYYIKYEQPFFLPNELKNNIEDAELDQQRQPINSSTYVEPNSILTSGRLTASACRTTSPTRSRLSRSSSTRNTVKKRRSQEEKILERRWNQRQPAPTEHVAGSIEPAIEVCTGSGW